MSKVDIKRLDSVTKNDTTATKQINDNFQALQAAIENTVSRDGTVPNYMDADLDLNSYRIINAGDPVGERDVVTLKYFEEKAGGAIEAAAEAKTSASKAASSAQSALVASNNAIGQLAQAEGLLTAAEGQLEDTKQYIDAAKSDIDSTVAQAKSDINTAVSNAESNISTIVSNAEGSITNIAVTEANKAIANAAQEATDIATANVNSYVDGTIKPSLQTYVNQAQESANSAATSMEQAALSATTASNDASNASADADNAANSAAAAKVSENNAKASETNVEATKAEVEAIAELASFGNIGDIKYTSRTDVPNGGAWCDGAEYTKAQFPDVYQMLVDGKLQSTTVTEFDILVSANGSCGFFGLDTANECFKVPMLKDVYLKAGQAPSMFGAESLPNIKGNLGSIVTQRATNPINDYQGAFKANNTDNYSSSSTSTSFRATGVTFDASRSSSTYKDNVKVNPDHVVYRAYVVLYSSAAEASVAQAAEFINGLSNKADDSAVVHKDLEEVITGYKTFRNSHGEIAIFQADNIDSTVAPSATTHTGIDIRDTNGIRIGKLEVGHSANNDILTSLSVSRKINGTMKYKNFSVYIDSSGNGWIENLRPNYDSLVGLGMTLGTRKTMPADGVLFINVQVGSQSNSTVSIHDGSGHAIGVVKHNGGSAELNCSTFTAIVAKGQSINCTHNAAGNASIVSSYLAPWR